MGRPRHPMTGMDAFAPNEIAALVETRGVAKASATVVTTFVLGVLAGAFIGLGAVLSTTSITIVRLLRNWALVYVGNLVGALSIVLMVWLAEWWKQSDGAVGATALAIAAAKTSLPFGVVVVRGILANALVCLAVWLATGGRTVTDKVIAIVFPISAFVAAGFEHSVANMYFIPIGLLLERDAGLVASTSATPDQLGSLDVAGFVTNLTAATIGNVIGGAALVGLVYWFVYLRDPEDL